MRRNASDFLAEGAKTHEERNALYGDSYHGFGAVMLALFPDGITLSTESDFNRFAVLMHIVGKIHRYTASFNKVGGHPDSAHDAMVYSAMLQELDQIDIVRHRNNRAGKARRSTPKRSATHHPTRRHKGK